MAPMIPLGSLAILVAEVRHSGHNSGLEHSWLALSEGLPNSSTEGCQIPQKTNATGPRPKRLWDNGQKMLGTHPWGGGFSVACV